MTTLIGCSGWFNLRKSPKIFLQSLGKCAYLVADEWASGAIDCLPGFEFLSSQLRGSRASCQFCWYVLAGSLRFAERKVDS
jgi:hypothetical protein